MESIELNNKVYYWEKNKIYHLRRKTLRVIKSFNSYINGISVGRDVLYVFLSGGSVYLLEGEELHD